MDCLIDRGGDAGFLPGQLCPRPGGGDRPGMSGWDIYKNRESHYTGLGSFIERNQSGADHCSGDSSGDESGDRNTEDVVRGLQNQTD